MKINSLKLDTDKLDKELKRLGKSRSWLASKMGVSRQSVSYYFRERSICQVERMGIVLGIDPKELII